MSAERCRVCAVFDGIPQYYQRDQEQKRNGRWVAFPLFVPNPKQAVSMSEVMARHFAVKCQGFGIRGLWLEDCKDGRRIEVDSPSQPQSGEDNRTAIVASLDDVNYYVVYPIARPDGRKYFLKINVPGIGPQVIYSDEPLAVLQRALDMNFLQFAVKYEPPPQPAAPVQNSNGWRVRPGSLR